MLRNGDTKGNLLTKVQKVSKDGCSAAPLSGFHQRSMYHVDEEAAIAEEQSQNHPVTLEEATICIVAAFPDQESAQRHFDISKNGNITSYEFVTGMRGFGFSDADSINIFKQVLKQVHVDAGGGLSNQVLDKKEFAALWRFGGGSLAKKSRWNDTHEMFTHSATMLGKWSSPASPGSSVQSPRPHGSESSVQSFGPFLEEKHRRMDILTKHDLEDPVLLFGRWATGRWEKLHCIFTNEEISRSSVRRKANSTAFVNFVKRQGFEGNVFRVFKEIQKEGPQQQEISKASKHAARFSAHDHATDEGPSERDEITLAQLMAFQKRCQAAAASLDAGDQGSPLAQLLKVLREKRGCMLRIWRQDFDSRGTGRVTQAEFRAVCKTLLGPGEAKQLMMGLRPNGNPEPLELKDLDMEEAENVNKFAECLWANFSFDLDRAWAIVEPCGRGNSTVDDFTHGVKSFGFEGNAKMLFKGLTAESQAGLGRLYRHEFDYIHVFGKANERRTHSAPSMKALSSWVQHHFGDIDVFLGKIGFADNGQKPQDDRKLTVSDLAARLTALGFPGDALYAASVAARAGAGTYVGRDKLYSLLGGKRAGAPPRRNSNAAWAEEYADRKKNYEETLPDPAPPGIKIPKAEVSWRPAKVWKNELYNNSTNNGSKFLHVRDYFSSPRKKGGKSMLDADSPTAPKSREGSSSPRRNDASPKVDSNRGSSPSKSAGGFSPPSRTSKRFSANLRKTVTLDGFVAKPAWDTTPTNTSENGKNPAATRTYFSDPTERPVKEEIRRQRNIKEQRQVPGRTASSPTLSTAPSR